jgi:hypothetical protein
MKRVLPVIAVLFSLVLPCRLLASVDLSIGGTAGYIWWKPAWHDSKSYLRYATTGMATAGLFYLEDVSDFRTAGNVMGGPVLHLRFPGNWSISSVFIIGRYLFRENGPSAGGGLACINPPGICVPFINAMVNKYERECLKWDSDTTLGYSFNRYLKIFAGVKIQGYRYTQRLIYNPFNDINITVRDLQDSVQNYGPGLGLGLTVPLVENLYLMSTLSGIVLWGFEQVKVNRSYNVFAGVVTPYFFYYPDGRFLSYGFNATLSFGYYIEKIRTMIAIGGRYQLLYNRQNTGGLFKPDVALNIINGQYDNFFGITMSVTYTFKIGKDTT